MNARVERKAVFKEDVKHVLEELFDAEEEEPFYKILIRECQNGKGTQKVLRYSKAELQDFLHRDNDGTVHCLRKHEVGYACMLVHYQCDLRVMELFPENIENFRFN